MRSPRDCFDRKDGGTWLSPAAAAALAQERGCADLGALALDLLPLAASRARPEISGFRVGAVAVGRSGALYAGANLEIRGGTLSMSLHAEQAAIANAHRAGETGLTHLAVTATPCGFCRQFMQEIADAGMIQILRPGRPPVLLSTLLPDAFGPADLGVTDTLFAPVQHDLVFCQAPSPADANLAHAALDAARRSYCPYSRCPSGIALALADGTLWAGSVIESAAHNPTLPPWLMAVSALSLNRHDSHEIRHIAQVEIFSLNYVKNINLQYLKKQPKIKITTHKIKYNF